MPCSQLLGGERKGGMAFLQRGTVTAVAPGRVEGTPANVAQLADLVVAWRLLDNVTFSRSASCDRVERKMDAGHIFCLTAGDAGYTIFIGNPRKRGLAGLGHNHPLAGLHFSKLPRP
jgi:hypothetical protein